jgi:transposase
MEAYMPGQRKQYDKEFKINAVQLYETSGKKLHDLEEELGIGMGCISHWRREFQVEQEKSFPGNGNIKEKDKEFIRLKRENEILRQERDILKKALGIFSKTPG